MKTAANPCLEDSGALPVAGDARDTASLSELPTAAEIVPREAHSLKRCRDWQERLQAFVAARLAAPFVWGVNDCALFAAGGVQAITGADFAAALGASHTSARTAWRAARAAGGLEGLARAALGPPLPAAYARPGDVVLLPMGRWQALGLCNGAGVLGPGPRGLVTMPRAQALACWRVG